MVTAIIVIAALSLLGMAAEIIREEREWRRIERKLQEQHEAFMAHYERWANGRTPPD